MQDFFRTKDAFGGRLVDSGRPRGVQVNLGQRPNAIGGHVHPARDLLLIEQPRPECLLDAGRHTGSGLARTDDRDAANPVQRQGLLTNDEAVALHPQILAHQAVAAHGSKARVPDGQGIVAEVRAGFG